VSSNVFQQFVSGDGIGGQVHQSLAVVNDFVDVLGFRHGLASLIFLFIGVFVG